MGTPRSLESVEVYIYVDFYKTMFDFQDLEFEKTYVLNVKRV